MIAEAFETTVASAEHLIREARRELFLVEKTGYRDYRKLKELKLRLARERKEIERRINEL